VRKLSRRVSPSTLKGAMSMWGVAPVSYCSGEFWCLILSLLFPISSMNDATLRGVFERDEARCTGLDTPLSSTFPGNRDWVKVPRRVPALDGGRK